MTTFNRGPLYEPDGDYEIRRTFWDVFDVFPKGSAPWVCGFVLAGLFVVGLTIRSAPVADAPEFLDIIREIEEPIELPELWDDAATSRLSAHLQDVVSHAVHDAFAPINADLDRIDAKVASLTPAPLPPPPAPLDSDDLRIVSKGCRCRHRLAVAKGGALGWMDRTWHDVSFEDWQWAQVDDRWPLPPPDMRPDR